MWFWLDSKPHDAKWMTREEQDALVGAIDEEQRQREALTSVKPTLGKLLKDRQILLFCALYFCIQLTIYAATFWLPSIIKKMGDLSDVQVGFFNSIPWLISIIAMYAFASLSGKFEVPTGLGRGGAVDCSGRHVHVHHRRASASPLWRFASRPSGFKSASSLFWPIPQGYLDVRIAAAVIALINSIGNLGGFVAPTTFWLSGADHRLDPRRPLRPGRYLSAGGDPGVFRQDRALCPIDVARRSANRRGPQQTSLSLFQEFAMNTPVVTHFQVIPVAGHDSMLLNLSGAHGPFFTRNIVILKGQHRQHRRWRSARRRTHSPKPWKTPAAW